MSVFGWLWNLGTGLWNFGVQSGPSILHFVCGQADKVAEVVKYTPGG